MSWFLNSGADEHNIPEPCTALVESYWTAAQKLAESDKNDQTQSSSLSASQAANALLPSLAMNVSMGARAKSYFHRVLPNRVRLQLRKTLDRALGRVRPDLKLQSNERGPKVESGLPFGVGLFGYHITETGVGEGARSAAKALAEADIPFSRHVLTTGGHFHDKFGTIEDFDGDVSKYPINLFHMNADNTLDLPARIDPRNLLGRYKIGYWAWELAKFPEDWVPALDQVDEIWAPSQFVADAVRGRTRKPVQVVPHPVVPAKATANRSKFNLPEDKFLVLTSFDLNSYFSRKNPRGAIDAFQAAFPHQDDVGLVVKFHGGAANFDDERSELLAMIHGDERILTIDQVLSREEMDQLQESVDCFISLHRSEGFGLNIAEMMGRGKPVVSTAYSGSNEFVSSDTAFPIGFTMKRVGTVEYPFGVDQYWANASIAHAAKALVEVYSGSDRAAQIRDAGARLIETAFSYGAIGEIIRSRIEEIRSDYL
jgi:glycosyltransferase involved in cell wall biosynthesis